VNKKLESHQVNKNVDVAVNQRVYPQNDTCSNESYPRYSDSNGAAMNIEYIAKKYLGVLAKFLLSSNERPEISNIPTFSTEGLHTNKRRTIRKVKRKGTLKKILKYQKISSHLCELEKELNVMDSLAIAFSTKEILGCKNYSY
jgi:hypothetical protein